MGWSRYFRRARWDQQRREELDSYLQIETDENIARGMSRDVARRAAQRKLGNRTLVREEIYEMNSILFLDTLARDVRSGLRALRRNPAFTAVALLTLAIGIGANTAVFSVVNSVLLQPLAYPNPEELVAVWQKAPGAEGLSDASGDLRLSASMYFTYAEQNRTLQALGVWVAVTSSVTGLGEPEEVRTVLVSDGVLQALSVPPLLGRWLSQADQMADGAATVVLSHGYWQRRFGGDRSVIGRNIMVDSRPREVVGVMPQSFRVANVEADLIVPLAFDRRKLILPGFGFQGIARLKTGVTIAQANADIARLVPIWMNSWPMVRGVDPHIYEHWRIAPALRPLKQDVVGGAGKALWTLMATIGIVLLIASANVANLLLVRSEARQQELAVRAALGAGWGRIVRVLLLESVLLGLMGGMLGLGVAEAGLRFLVATGPAGLPRLGEIRLDAWALGFTLAASIFSGLLFGMIPAWKYAGPRTSLTLRSGGRTHSAGREQHRTRNLLVVVQVALALVLLVSSGLMMRTFQALRSVDPGFTHAEQIQTVRISIPNKQVPEPVRVVRMQNEILDRLAAIAGVTSVGFSSELPMESGNHDWDAVCLEDQVLKDAEIPPLRIFKSISPGLFQTTGTRLISGREFAWADLYDRRPVAMVSENFAREKWGDPTAALGKRITTCIPGAPKREVIGVVQNVHDNGVQEPAPVIVYWPSFGESLYRPGSLEAERAVTFAIRSKRAGSESFLNEVSQAVWSVNKSLPLASVRTMQDISDHSMARVSFTLVMLGIAGVMALVLGLVGIYGVISYVVTQRQREIGIRLALGAQQDELQRMFVRYGLRLAVVGVVVGWAAAAGLTGLMKSLLFGIRPLDPLTFAVVPVVLVAAGMIASYVPARRAAAVDPAVTLRGE